MIRVNLLPSKFKSKTAGAKEYIAICVLCLIVAVLAVGYLWTEQNKRVAQLNRKLAELDRQVRDLADFEKKLAELKAKKDIVARKSEVVENLRQDRDKMVRLLAVLAVSTPVDQIWFERLQESGNGVTITGTAKSDDAIVEFMRNLEASPYIAPGSVSLRHSRKKGDLRDFQLSCGFVPYSAVQQKLKAAASPSEKKKADGTKVN